MPSRKRQERAIIDEREVGGSLGFRFTHAFFRQTLYEEIFAARRIRSHQQVARALEEVYAIRLEEHAPELAEHFSNSTDSADLAKAVHYGELAAKRSMSVYAYGEAIRHIEQALHAQEVLDPDDAIRRCDLLLALGEPLLATYERDRAREEVAAEPLALAERLDDSTRAFEACRLALDTMLDGLRPQTPYWIEMGQKHAGTDPRARMRLVRVRAVQHLAEGHASIAAEEMKGALKAAQDLGDPDWEYSMLWGLLNFSPGALPLGELSRIADEYSDRSRNGARSRDLVASLWQMAMVRLAQGRKRDARRLMAEIGELADRTKNAGIVIAYDNIVHIESALDGKLSGEDLDGLVGNNWSWRVASAEWLGVPPHERRNTGRQPNFYDFGRDAWLHAARGENEATQICLDNALRILRDDAGAIDSAPILGWLLHAAVLLSDAESCQLAVSRFEHGNMVLLLSQMMAIPFERVLGDAAVLLGRIPAAHAYYERALDVCELVGHRPERAVARLSLADLLLDHYPDERDAAIEHLDFAIAEFREMKMQPSLERALRHRGLLKA